MHPFRLKHQLPFVTLVMLKDHSWHLAGEEEKIALQIREVSEKEVVLESLRRPISKAR
jgi:hypothetical protein